jgi:hypothetical protein
MRNEIEMGLSMSFLKPNKCAKSLDQWIVTIPFLKPALTRNNYLQTSALIEIFPTIME